MQDLNISLIQSNIYWENTEKNLSHFGDQLTHINKNTELVVLPEMFSTGFTMNVDSCAEPMDGKTVSWLKTVARDKQYAIAGSVLIRENNRFFNRFLVATPDGELEYYDKRHLFSMAGENEVMTSGSNKKIIHLKGWNINLMVCYDLRFPVWSMNKYNSGEHQYDVLIYVANWPRIRNHAYKTLIPARAIENQCFTVWVNRIGMDGNGKEYSGDSMVVGPKGNILVTAPAGKEQVVNITLSKTELLTFRSGFKVGQDWDEYSIHD